LFWINLSQFMIYNNYYFMIDLPTVVVVVFLVL